MQLLTPLSTQCLAFCYLSTTTMQALCLPLWSSVVQSQTSVPPQKAFLRNTQHYKPNSICIRPRFVFKHSVSSPAAKQNNTNCNPLERGAFPDKSAVITTALATSGAELRAWPSALRVSATGTDGHLSRLVWRTDCYLRVIILDTQPEVSHPTARTYVGCLLQLLTSILGSVYTGRPVRSSVWIACRRMSQHDHICQRY
jgi:hypothetical protein